MFILVESDVSMPSVMESLAPLLPN